MYYTVILPCGEDVPSARVKYLDEVDGTVQAYISRRFGNEGGLFITSNNYMVYEGKRVLLKSYRMFDCTMSLIRSEAWQNVLAELTPQHIA